MSIPWWRDKQIIVSIFTYYISLFPEITNPLLSEPAAHSVLNNLRWEYKIRRNTTNSQIDSRAVFLSQYFTCLDNRLLYFSLYHSNYSSFCRYRSSIPLITKPSPGLFTSFNAKSLTKWNLNLSPARLNKWPFTFSWRKVKWHGNFSEERPKNHFRRDDRVYCANHLNWVASGWEGLD